MTTLAEIEAAAGALPTEEKQRLLLFLATRLRSEGAKLPEPRHFESEQIAAWLGEDQADMDRLRGQS